MIGSRFLRSNRGDSFYFWLDVGLLVFVLGLCGLFLLVDSKRPKESDMSSGSLWSSKAHGIDVWMPLGLLLLFLVGGIFWGIATAR